MASCELDSEFLLEFKNAFLTFIREEGYNFDSFLSDCYWFSLDKRIIDNNNFSDFQNIVRLQNKIPGVAKIPENESERAKHFREKRELRDAIKRKQQGAKCSIFFRFNECNMRLWCWNYTTQCKRYVIICFISST